MEDQSEHPQLGPVIVHLMRGVVYRDQHEKVWQALMALQAAAIDYLRVIGIELEVDEAEGYAYLKQTEAGELQTEPMPRLIQRRPLSYPVSLLCVLLRKKLVEADSGGDEIRVILTRDQIVEMMRVFLPDQANEAKLVDRIDTHINKVVELGFLRKHKKAGPVFEVRRILKALVDADWLVDMDEKLRVYREHAKTT
jgi:Domain of unknown function (DUF4194)